MNEEQLLKDLIQNLDDLIEPKKIWLEWTSDAAISLIVKQGYKKLKELELDQDFLQLVEAYLTSSTNNFIQESADMLAAIFILLFIKDKKLAMGKLDVATKIKYKIA